MKKIIVFVVIAFQTARLLAQETVVPGAKEKEGLLHMREEEKLARDVYDSMYVQWDVNPFGNIRQSERVHMDRMKTLLEQYSIADPVSRTNDQPGQFVNKEMQSLYNQLVSSGSQSLADALKAGAKIEELDIADLDKRIAGTANKDILAAYSFLRMGSENHLRAFVRRLKAQGVDYKPEFLDQAEFDTIINGENNLRGNGQGKGPGHCMD